MPARGLVRTLSSSSKSPLKTTPIREDDEDEKASEFGEKSDKEDEMEVLQRYIMALERELKKQGIPANQLEAIRKLALQGIIPDETPATRRLSGSSGRQVAKLLGLLQDDENELSEDIRQKLEMIEHQLQDSTVEIRYRNLRYSAQIDKNKPKIETVATAMPCFRKAPEYVQVDILNSLNGIIEPGTMTLVVGPPGCGKTSYLKALGARLVPNVRNGAQLSGDITYNGAPVYEKKSRGFVRSKVAAFIGQIDDHSPSLTVEDTFRFAFAMLSVNDNPIVLDPDDTTSPLHNDTLESGNGLELKDVSSKQKEIKKQFAQKMRQVKIRNTLEVLGIAHVAATIVGNAQLRGVSGGQRRRVTVGEMLFGRARVLCCDEISTGLDSKTTYEIVKALGNLTRTIDSTTIIALLQPPPEVFRCFDQVVLLDAGRLCYHGPANEILDYLETSVGFKKPERKDTADFLVEVTTSEGRAYAVKPGAPYSAAEFASHFMQSEYYQDMNAKLDNTTSTNHKRVAWSHFHTTDFTESLFYYMKWIAWRRVKEIRGAPSIVQARVGQAFAVGLVIGTLYYDLGYHEYASKMGLLFTVAVYLGLGSLSSIPNLLSRRSIFYKHRDAGFYPTTAYVLSSLVTEIPVISLEVGIFGTLVFWLASLAPSAYPLFMIICFALSLACQTFFTAIACLAPADGAVQMAGMCVTFFIYFSGFIVRRSKTPKPWRPVYWANPMAYALRALAVNEFRSDKYEKTAYLQSLGIPNPSEQDGVFFLRMYDFQHKKIWVLYGLCFLFGYAFTCLLIQTIMLTIARIDVSASLATVDDEDSVANLVEVVDGTAVDRGDTAAKDEKQSREAERMRMSMDIAHGFNNSSQTENNTKDEEGTILFTPITYAFSDIKYSVFLKNKNEHGEPERLELLSGVTAFAKPATMTALMGSSGAGKTTLLDCIAGRKTGGELSGKMTLNGHKKTQNTLTRVSGYVEQLDVHSPGSTVREAAEFSASLRLPADVSPIKRAAFVTKIMGLLELENIQDKLVGTIANGGLTFEQRKRLTMAVELAANPSILFLDEPTSGLDSRAALVVIRAVANISASGRSVICTIHQPSYALFSTFDYLLLLKKGGHTVYFGALGNECSSLVDYLRDAARDLGYELPPLEAGANPATWMLNVCEQKVADFGAAYHASPLGQHNAVKVAEAQVPEPGTEPITFDTEYAVDDMTQYLICCKRLAISYWRSPAYNVPRLVVSIFLAFVYGSCYTYKVDDVSDAISRVAFFFMSTFNQGVIYCNVAIPVMAAERDSFYRERASRFYKVGPYAASFTIVELPFLLFFSLVFVACLYSVVDMYPGFDKFLWYWAFYFSYVTLLTFLGQFLVVALPNFETAQSVAATFFSVMACFCGFTIAPDDIPSGWKFLFYANPAHYVLEGQVVTQFRGVNHKIAVAGLENEWTLSRYMTSGNSDSYWSGEYTWGHRYGNILTLVIFFCGLRLATILAFTKIAYVTR